MTDCKQIAKRYLKTLSPDKIEEISRHPDLTDLEHWILYYTYAKQRLVVNTCMKLNISERQFFILLSEALTKLYYILELKTVQF